MVLPAVFLLASCRIHEQRRVLLSRPDGTLKSGAGVRPRRTEGRHAMTDSTVRGVVHLIEDTKSFGQKIFRKRL